ncbi:MAG: hypothetical protein ISR96_06500 [Nitrospira sp.]|nr:hypothetical protein [bacterium]MBL7049144.1 hypothetical protein [Nitrospira sp.]
MLKISSGLLLIIVAVFTLSVAGCSKSDDKASVSKEMKNSGHSAPEKPKFDPDEPAPVPEGTPKY